MPKNNSPKNWVQKSKSFFKHHWIILLISSGFLFTVIIFTSVMIVLALLTSNHQKSLTEECGEDVEQSVITGKASGQWIEKGTKANNLAKKIYKEAKKLGMDDAHAAAVVGNAVNEGAGTGVLKLNEVGGGKGRGIFQFTEWDPPYGWSVAGQVKSIMTNAGDGGRIRYPNSATKAFYELKTSPADLASYFMNVFEIPAPETAHEAERRGDAQKAYEMWKGVGGEASEDAIETGDVPDNECNNESSTDTSDIIEVAKHMKGWFTYDLSRSAIMGKTPEVNDYSWIDKNGTLECAGYVWTVLKVAGYKVPDGGYATPQMRDDIEGPQNWFKKISSNQARAGDVIVVNKGVGYGGDGHTAILLEKWHGKGTKIIQQGGSQLRYVNTSIVSYAFGKLYAEGQVSFGRPISN